jgi:trehalose 6-phosphate phosphatase
VKPLLSVEGRQQLRRLARGKTLYAFDFDGTLAPIVSDPAQARAAEHVTRPLAELARIAPVAVLSGRARRELIERLPTDIPYLVGNHGNEGLPDAAPSDVRAEVCRAWRVLLEPRLQVPRGEGVWLEDKGQSLSLHYRAAQDHATALEFLRQTTRDLDPAPTVITGKLVLNLLPPGSATKFEALQTLVAHAGVDHVLFVGDDDTDEIVFSRAPEGWITVRIDPRDGSSARYYLDEQASVEVLLTHLLAEYAEQDHPVPAKAKS